MDLIHILWGVLIFCLGGWNYMQQQQSKQFRDDIKENQRDIVDVKVGYVHKDEIRDLKEFIGRGFDKLETQISSKMDKVK